MGRTILLNLVLVLVWVLLVVMVSRVQSSPSEDDPLKVITNTDLLNWKTEEKAVKTNATDGEAAAVKKQKDGREKRQDINTSIIIDEGDPTRLKHLAIEKALTARKIPPTHKDKPIQCDELITNDEFYIHSPGYPANYPGNTSCKYEVFKRHDNVCGVVFTVLRLDLATPYGIALDNVLEGHEGGGGGFGGAFGGGERGVRVRVRGSIGEGKGEEEEDEALCPGDSLIINNVLYCGRYRRGKTATFIFKEPFMTVEFRSRAGHGASGFLLQGRQVTTCRQPRSLGPPLESSAPCNRRLRGESFVVRSPGYPRQYAHNLECRYTVERAGPHICEVQLVMQGFSVEDGSCMFDYLEVQGHRLCGMLPPGFTRHFDFEDEELHIRFRSDESTKRSGFVITGQQIPCDKKPPPLQSPLSQSFPDSSKNQTVSPAVTTNQPRTFQTPSSTSAGNSGSDINFILNLLNRGRTEEEEGKAAGPEGRNISEEDFTEVDPGLFPIDAPDDDHTNADQNIPGSPDFNPFTGAGLPPTIPTFPTNPTTFTNTFPTTFPTFPTTTGVDFPVTTVTRQDCDQLIASLTAEIQSPNYPNNYPVSVDCAYVVGRAALDVCRLEVTFIDMDVPSRDPITSQCNTDYLEVGGTRFCGTIQNRVESFSFTGQTVSLNFHSDAATTGRGFQVRVSQKTDGCTTGPILPPILPGQCDSTVTDTAFQLLSPGYPVRYPPNTDCTTTVLRSSNEVTSLFLNLVDFELGTTIGCTGDYLEVGGERLCGVLSGQTRTVPFIGSSIIIRFHSGPDISNGGRGYRIRAAQTSSAIIPGGCGGYVTTTTANLRSPNYPNAYPPNSNCRYIVNKVSQDVCQLQLKIIDMDIENGVGCARDYLQIGVQERLCGRRIPGEIRKYHFSGSQLEIIFHSDTFGSGRGFNIDITQTNCGHFKPMYPYRPTQRPHYYYPHNHHHHHHRPHRPNHHRPWWNYNSRPKYPYHQYSSGYTQQTTPCIPHFPFSPQWSTTTPLPHTTVTHPTIPPPTPFPPTTLSPFPTVTPVSLIPRPPALQVSNVSSTSISTSTTSSSSEDTTEGGDREAKRILGRDRPCHQVVDTERFSLQSPGYPAPYYVNARCLYTIYRRSRIMCGVELEVEEFDVERSPACSNAYLFLAQRRYCGSINKGSQSLIPFNGTEPIVLLFVGGQFNSGAGFKLRGRQIPCGAEETVPRAAGAMVQRRQFQDSNGEQPRNKRIPLPTMEEVEEAEWLEPWLGNGEVVLEEHGTDGLTHR